MIQQQPLTLKLYNRQVNYVSLHHTSKSALSSSDRRQASKTFRLLSLNITAEKWSDAVQLQITEPLFVMYTFYF
jgi:hypothetical protein